MADLKKQKELTQAQVHLVELDWLRSGRPTTRVDLARLAERTGGPFDDHIAVSYHGPQHTVFSVAIRMQDPLPTSGVPLEPLASPVTIELQPIFNRTYKTGSCRERIDDRQPPLPPLSDEQARWALGLIDPEKTGSTPRGDRGCDPLRTP